MIHVLFHFLIPLIISLIFFRSQWKKSWLLLSLTMLVDLDHLLASPIYDPARCSINFHPLHTVWAIAIYVALLVPKSTRLISIGLLIHMLLDWQECWMPIDELSWFN